MNGFVNSCVCFFTLKPYKIATKATRNTKIIEGFSLTLLYKLTILGEDQVSDILSCISTKWAPLGKCHLETGLKKPSLHQTWWNYSGESGKASLRCWCLKVPWGPFYSLKNQPIKNWQTCLVYQFMYSLIKGHRFVPNTSGQISYSFLNLCSSLKSNKSNQIKLNRGFGLGQDGKRLVFGLHFPEW